MKKSILIIGAIMIIILANAQNNVGINTTSPQATLDVRGSQRFGGATNYMKYDSATGRIEWVGAALYAPVSQQIIRHSNSSEGLYAGDGRLEYRSSSSPVFFSDWTTGNGYFSGSLGIGTSTPLGRLHIQDGSAGLYPFMPSQLVLESNAFTYMSFLSRTSHESGILFANETNNASGGIIYGNSSTPNGFQFRNNGNVTKVVIDNAGRMGIGTLTPNAPLTFPPAFGKKITLYPAGSGDVGMAVQGNLLQIYADNPNADIAFGYDQAGTIVERMRIKGNGNVGIGTSTPNAPLTFPSTFGKKITLYPAGTGDVGLAVLGNLLQIYADNPNADIAFGYDQAGVMTERMRIKGNGNVGIGTNNPQYPLDINGGMKLTGPINMNGNQGSAGQVMQSNGAGAAPSWASSTNALYNNTFQVTAGASGTIAIGSGNSVLVPGMSSTFNLVGNAKVMIQFNVMATTLCSNCLGNVDIEIICDGNHMRTFEWRILNNSSLTLSASDLLTLGPGSHTISLLATSWSVITNFGFVAGANPAILDTMILQIIPQ